MTDQNPVVPNSCLSSPNDGPVDVIWSSTDFHQESCLPVIGSCQVSSILSTLENVEPKEPATAEKRSDDLNNEDLNTFKSISINIINADSLLSVDEVRKRFKNKNETPIILSKNRLFSEMMYFGCNLCPFICTKDSKISDHIQNVHKNKASKRAQLKCPVCPNIFYHKLSLRSHLIHDHEMSRNDINKIVNSVVYGSVLTENNNLALNNLEKEKQTNEEKKGDNSDFLPESITLQENTDMEDEPIDFLENSEPPALNDSGDYSPKQETSEEIKLPKEDQKRAQKCCVSTCAVRMNDIVNMSYHVKCHFGKIFRCLECSTNFVAWKTLQTHLWRSHNIDMELYSCDKCDYKTYSLAKLNNIHKLIHGDEKPFLCDLCGKGFKNPKQLRNHKIIHKAKNIEKMHPCEICNRAFQDKRLLRTHVEAVHQKLKPFPCNYCGYKAASNGALKLHIRIHTGQKPFSCDSCDYSSADHNSLRRHKLRHSGEKKYTCVHCDYACIQSSTYKTHLKTKHPGVESDYIFSCNFCQFRTVNKDKYMIHIAAHKDETEGLGERVVEIVKKVPKNQFPNLINLKPQTEKSNNRLEETPVALITNCKINDITQTNQCFILPVQNENVLNLTNSTTENSVLPTTTAIPINNVQYFYSGSNVLLEVTDQKTD